MVFDIVIVIVFDDHFLLPPQQNPTSILEWEWPSVRSGNNGDV